MISAETTGNLEAEEIKVGEMIVEITVSEISKSRNWYARLFGKKGPDLEPFEGNIEFKAGPAWGANS